VPRPTSGDLTLRSFDIPATTATHVQLRVLSNQCTGAPAYQDDNDPTDNVNCDSGTFAGEPTTAGQNVRIAELQVFSGNVR
jgi:hypothetical protein